MISAIKRNLLALIIGSYLVVAATSILLASEAPQQPAQTASAQSAQKPAKTGEQVFNNNCSRCHQPPMSIPPRATGTVVMHMRTRARLSREDEQLLLRFLAP
jgi:cytochrome c5